jgi:hypothetical protein
MVPYEGTPLMIQEFAMTTLIIVTGAVVIAAAAYYVRRARSPAPEKTFHVVRCGHCSQKVRYPARKAGGIGMCPRCLRCLVMPETPQPLALPHRPCRVGERLVRV